ncbi:AMP-binding protein [Arthrobacter yangruifuii]|uniref:AMP-binding protein n=1 Tax=Arthrobacter yangruifuii TaxID=2606616 RepID=A0A5N6MHB0_9MICC|nr:AMP-binding protein [Arthrobacter yangruifuii]KAD3514865.1 AMP-binding protein [Arthrobacter yangruifuii]
MTGLDTALTPLRFLERASAVHPDKTAVIDGERQLTYREFAAAVTRTAHALRASGLTEGARAAFLGTNSAELLIAHYAVPLAGGVLVPLNTRLSPPEVAYICNHSGAALLFGDPDLLRGLGSLGAPELETVTEVISVPLQDGSEDTVEGTTSYAVFTARGADTPLPWTVEDEHTVISLNYTSGTTGLPKGVMYTHRGAYLNSLAEIHHQGFGADTVYLWTLPMFHCNGWCTTWALTGASGTHVCLRAVRGPEIWRLIDTHGIDHLAGAPTVLSAIATAEEAHVLERPLTIVTAGAPPSPTVIGKIHQLQAAVVHVYGLTESYGPYAVCEPQAAWDGLDPEALAKNMARQGVGMLTAERLRVVRDVPDADGTLLDVVPDGVEMGEIVMRGNSVMRGYYRDDDGTAEAFRGGWFHTGDLGVMHPDGYVQLLDRSKDVVVSGGENISTIEVEQALASHPAVADVAVIGVPDERWGERPKAFVVLVPGLEAGNEELLAHVKARIASYKAPRSVEFIVELPKTSTGKIRKNELRSQEWEGREARIN